MGPVVMLLARNLLLAVIAVDAARLVARAPMAGTMGSAQR
jgi:hypothetical protein